MVITLYIYKYGYSAILSQAAIQDPAIRYCIFFLSTYCKLCFRWDLPVLIKSFKKTMPLPGFIFHSALFIRQVQCTAATNVYFNHSTHTFVTLCNGTFGIYGPQYVLHMCGSNWPSGGAGVFRLWASSEPRQGH